MRPVAVRADIQGLRAVAVTLVLVYHLWPGRLSGGYVGVDVFFVISGFLITAHLLQHPPRGPLDLAEFWGRRIRRLLPAAFLVLGATLVAARVLAPETQWGAVAREVIASALYVQNWVLAANAVDYLAAANAPTPTQHYWSLAVEEQFYLVWPILILVACWLARRFRLGTVSVARVAMALVVAASLATSMIATATEPAGAYFVTQTRVWELAVGGLIATLPSAAGIGMPTRQADALAWLGMAMILLAGLVFDGTTPFPGSAALLPVVGTGFVIFAATQRWTSPTGVLRFGPIQHIGDTSYSIYLWHWPLIVLAPHVTGSIGRVDAALIVVATVVLATLTKALVEDPFRFAPRFQPLCPTFRFAIAGMVVITAAGSIQLAEVQLRTDAAVAHARESIEAAASCVGAEAIVLGPAACPQDPTAPLVLAPAAALKDLPDSYRDGCVIDFPFSSRASCTYGDGAIRIALVGNSHAGQWLPALQLLAEQHGWAVTTFLTQQCNATDAALYFNTAEKTENCLAYGKWVMAETSGSAFDLVITSQRQSAPTRGDTFATTLGPATAGYRTYLERWQASGATILVLQDTPYPGTTVDYVPDCLAEHPADRRACDGTPADWYGLDPLYDAAAELELPRVITQATGQWFCTATRCPAVIGSVVVYADRSHMTATYSRSLAPYLYAPIAAALGLPQPGATEAGG